jgi:hypothetical protein
MVGGMGGTGSGRVRVLAGRTSAGYAPLFKANVNVLIRWPRVLVRWEGADTVTVYSLPFRFAFLFAGLDAICEPFTDGRKLLTRRLLTRQC